MSEDGGDAGCREEVAWLMKAASEEMRKSLAGLRDAERAASAWAGCPGYVSAEIKKSIARVERGAESLGVCAAKQQSVAAVEHATRFWARRMADPYGKWMNTRMTIRGDLAHPWIAGFSDSGGWAAFDEDVKFAAEAIAAGVLGSPSGPPSERWGPGGGIPAAVLRSCWVEQVNIAETRAAALAAGTAVAEDYEEASYLQMVSLYRAALDNPGPVTVEETLSAHSAIMDGLLQDEDDVGRLRDGLVQVGGYVAPDHYDAERLLHDLMGWLYEPELAECLQDRSDKGAARAFVRAAWGHLRFEQIHPFVDGNGRMGRWLEARLMAEHPRLTAVAHEGSAWCWDRQIEYYKALREAPESGDGAFTLFAVRRLRAQIWDRPEPAQPLPRWTTGPVV